MELRIIKNGCSDETDESSSLGYENGRSRTSVFWASDDCCDVSPRGLIVEDVMLREQGSTETSDTEERKITRGNEVRVKFLGRMRARRK